MDVLVVGAGPVGLTMAAELARYGVPVRIIDRAPARSDKSKALVLWSRTLELLARAGAADPFVAAGLKGTGANFFSGSRRITHVDLGAIPSPYNFGLMLPQSDTERLLEAHLQSLGVTVERQVELTDFSEAGDRVNVTLRHEDGSEEQAWAKWLVGCDGAHSAVRHHLALPFAGSTLTSDWLLADLHVTGLPTPETELAMFLHKDGVLAFFPMGHGRYRIIADQPASKDPRPPEPALTDIQAVVQRRGPGGVWLRDPVWLSGFRINERIVPRYRAGRVFLAGDAAHVHSPAGGQGMNTGMQDAFNLAWKLALVCRGAGPALLDSYSPERRAVGQAVLADSGRLTAVATLKSPLARAARNAAARLALRLPAIANSVAATLSETDILYKNSPLNRRLGWGGPRPGQRVAPRPDDPPPAAGAPPRFTLFAEATEAATALAAQDDLLDPAIRPPFGRGTLHLVRPDGYVALTGRAGDLDGGVKTYLASLRDQHAARQAELTDDDPAAPQ